MKCFHKTRFEILERRNLLAGHGDFNGDGFDDLAVGAPGETVDGLAAAGAVNIIYGGRRGLTATGNQFWHRNTPGVDGVAAAEDFFGSRLAVGDFNGDGFSDLAIGVASDTVNGFFRAGSVNVLYGSASGLRAGSVDQLWTQDSSGVNDAAEAGDQFGIALAAGDFNGDGRDDLAVGVDREDVGSIIDAGMVNVLYGSASGLTGKNDQHWHQNSSGINDVAEGVAEVGDLFGDLCGRALAAGDFNGDGRDDLAIGVMGENLGTIVNAGAVNVIYGSASGLTNAGDQFWHQDSAGVADDAETGDFFGGSLAAGDFNNDGHDDLAVAASQEAIVGLTLAGRVNLLYGSASKLKSSGGVKQLTAGALGFTTSMNAQFGVGLAAGDFDGDSRDDLAIGAPGETVSGDDFAGALYVAYGSSSLGLAVADALHLTQGDVGGTPSPAESIGAALATGDYDGDGRADLAVGSPNDGEAGASAAGAVFVIYAFGLIDATTPLWHQNLLSDSDGVESGDSFGSWLG